MSILILPVKCHLKIFKLRIYILDELHLLTIVFLFLLNNNNIDLKLSKNIAIVLSFRFRLASMLEKAGPIVEIGAKNSPKSLCSRNLMSEYRL